MMPTAGFDPPQQHAIGAALQVLGSWAEAAEATGTAASSAPDNRASAAGGPRATTRADTALSPDEVLLRELGQQDVATCLIGLATVARLLAMELGACSRRDERQVLADLGAIVRATGGRPDATSDSQRVTVGDRRTADPDGDAGPRRPRSRTTPYDRAADGTRHRPDR